MNFKSEFYSILENKNIDYEVKGIITANEQIYPLDSDTKVLSSVFEMFVRPLVYQVASSNNLIVREARAQNYYPDFTLMKSEKAQDKIAIDVKTTYQTGNRNVKFTLGSYTSFLRNETKNIEFPYSQYAEHWIIGFIYKRKELNGRLSHIYELEELEDIPTPFEDVDFFVARKWKIAGDKAGSGNTTNIGSISGQIEDFKNETGPFSSKEEFLQYWRNYGRTAADREYRNIEEFKEWKKGNLQR